jgi:hypothetical protein
MFGQLALDAPEPPYVPVDPDAGTEVLGVCVVEPVVAALAATAPPATSAPETARTDIALRTGLILLTSSAAGLRSVGYDQ